MSPPFVNGSVDWLIALREGAFSNLKPIPWQPRRRPKMRSEVAPSEWAVMLGPIEPAFKPREWGKPTFPAVVEFRESKEKNCAYCKRELVIGTLTHPTRDHIVPRSKGGRKTVWCCKVCNGIKGDMMPDAWDRFMKRYPTWWQATAKSRRAMLKEFLRPIQHPKPVQKAPPPAPEETLEQMRIRLGGSLPRGATLPQASATPPPLRPVPKMTWQELAHFLRHHAKKKGAPWPLA